MVNSKSYGAVSIVVIGALLILFSNIYYKDYHAENVELALKLLRSNQKEVLILWFLTLIGAALEVAGVIIMFKVTWSNIRYSYYEYNLWLHLLILLIVVMISIITIYFAVKAIFGIALLAMIVIALMYENDEKDKRKRR